MYGRNTKYITSLICSIIKFIYLHIFFPSSWRKIVTHLAWSLLGLSEGLTPLKSADSFSETIVLLLHAGCLVLALILLINICLSPCSPTLTSGCRYVYSFWRDIFPAYLINLISLVSLKSWRVSVELSILRCCCRRCCLIIILTLIPLAVNFPSG